MSLSLSLQHFREDAKLAEKLENLIDHANHSPYLTPNESNAAFEVSNMYQMQKEAQEEPSPVMQLKLSKEIVHLVCHVTQPSSHVTWHCVMFAAPKAV